MPYIYDGTTSDGSGGGTVVLPSFSINEDMELIATSNGTASVSFSMNDESELLMEV